MKIQQQTSNTEIYESALFRTTSTLLHTEQYLLIVDPNWLPQEVEFLFGRAQTLAAGRKCYLLFTHSDYDHIIGYGRFKEFTTIASKNFTTHPTPNEVLDQIRDFDDQYYLRRNYPVEYPEINIVIEQDGQTLQLGGDDYEFYQARGHNRDGLLTFNRTRGILLVGDYLSNEEFPYVYDSLARYRETLNKLERLFHSGGVRLLVSGHGDHTTDPREMQTRLRESRDYLDRLEEHVRTGTPFDTEALYRRYDFPKIMGAFHQKNIELMRRESSTRDMAQSLSGKRNE